MTDELTNSAVDLYRRFFQHLHDDRDLTRAVELLADDYVITMHDQFGLVLPKDQFANWYEDDLAVPLDFELAINCVATRGDLLCLTRGNVQALGSDFGDDVLNVLEINSAGRAVRGARFRNDDLKTAHDCLNRWWIDGLSPKLAKVASALVKGKDLIEDGDRTALIELLSDDFVLVDHRSLRPDQLNKDEVIDMWLTRQDATPGFTLLVSTVERLTNRAMLFTATMTTPDGSTTDLIGIAAAQEGTLVHLEEFDRHDLDRALARFEELASTPPR